MTPLVVAFLLIAEGASSGYWIATLLPRFHGFDAIVDVLIVLRAVVAVVQVSAAIALRGGRPAGARLTQVALGASAVLMVFEVGLGIAPSDLTPSLRWPIVSGYVGSSRVDLQACKLEYSIVSPK